MGFDPQAPSTGPFDIVRIVLSYANGSTDYTPSMRRWFAEHVLVNEIASGWYKGRRVLKAHIVTV